MSFSRELVGKYGINVDRNFDRYRRSVRRIRRRKYTSDDWINDLGGMWLDAVELAIFPYGLLFRHSGPFDVPVSKADTVETTWVLDADARGTSSAGGGTLVEEVGGVKQIVVTATTTPLRECLILKIPQQHTTPAIKDEVYTGDIMFGTRKAARVRVTITA